MNLEGVLNLKIVLDDIYQLLNEINRKKAYLIIEKC